jgi:hypothetical protein
VPAGRPPPLAPLLSLRLGIRGTLTIPCRPPAAATFLQVTHHPHGAKGTVGTTMVPVWWYLRRTRASLAGPQAAVLPRATRDHGLGKETNLRPV